MSPRPHILGRARLQGPTVTIMDMSNKTKNMTTTMLAMMTPSFRPLGISSSGGPSVAPRTAIVPDLALSFVPLLCFLAAAVVTGTGVTSISAVSAVLAVSLLVRLAVATSTAAGDDGRIVSEDEALGTPITILTLRRSNSVYVGGL